MSNITIAPAPSGLIQAAVTRSERISPNVMRVSLGGAGLQRFHYRGFDQWFRLAIPVRDHDRLDNLPQQFGMRGYLRYLTLPKGTRPVIRNYTVRAYRPDPAELDVDFVIHGTDGVAGPWADTVEPGTPVALIDQGCGFRSVEADQTLLVADESGMPAVAAILRDLPRTARGHALIELFDPRDRQELDAPAGMHVHWLERPHGSRPGTTVVAALGELPVAAESCYAFAVGESAVAVGTRRFLVGERGLHKSQVTFCGYWKHGQASPS